jgi:tight adherence protein C
MPAQPTPLIAFVVGIVAALAVLLIVASLTSAGGGNLVRTRLGWRQTAGASAREEELRRSMFDRLVRPLVSRLARIVGRFMTPARINRNAERLAQAGRPGGFGALEFMGFKVLLALAFGVGLSVLGAAGTGGSAFKLLLPLGAAGLAFIVPEFFVSRRIKRRQEQILLAVPDALDLLTISVKAGLSFDGALAKVVEKTNGPLAEEFRRALTEVRAGRPRRDALRDVANRAHVPALTSFIGAIAQAEQLGVPIARVLQIQSDQLRMERRQRAEELATKAPVKIIFPLVGCIFPSMFIVILGPAVILALLAFS